MQLSSVGSRGQKLDQQEAHRFLVAHKRHIFSRRHPFTVSIHRHTKNRQHQTTINFHLLDLIQTNKELYLLFPAHSVVRNRVQQGSKQKVIVRG